MRKVLYLSFVTGKLVSLGKIVQGGFLLLFESNDSGTVYNSLYYNTVEDDSSNDATRFTYLYLEQIGKVLRIRYP